MVQQQYSLHYFDGRGLAEPIRLLFIYVSQPFEDVRIQASPTDFTAWTEAKPKYFYGKLPVLFIDGGEKQLAQSTTILRYLGEKFGLAGKEEWERAKINELIDFHKDFYASLDAYRYVKSGFREGNLEQLKKEVLLPNVAQYFPIYVKLLKQSGSGFFTPSGVSIADFLVSDYIYTFKCQEPELLEEYPELVEHMNKVYALTQLKEYIAARKKSVW